MAKAFEAVQYLNKVEILEFTHMLARGSYTLATA